jgi:hypothetical protein
MNELIREIEEDIRKERLQKLWNSFGRTMVRVSIAIVLATVVMVVWQNQRQESAMKQTGQLIKGIDRMNIEDYRGAAAIFSAMAAEKNSYYSVAMLHLALAQRMAGDAKAAAETYKTLASHKGGKDETAFIELAKIMAAGSDPANLSPQKGTPFYHTQNEWKAWQLLKQGKKDEAASIFAALKSDGGAPVSVRERAEEMLSYLAPGKTAGEGAND